MAWTGEVGLGGGWFGLGSFLFTLGTLKMNDIRYFKAVIGGDRVMMHNDRLSDPLDPHTKALKAVTSKRAKSDDDHLEISRLEFMGGLYIDSQLGPYVPDKWLNAMLVSGAKKRRLGTKFEANVSVVDERHPLVYDGPRTADALFAAGSQFVDRRSVGNQQNRVMRTRPIFRNWRTEFEIQVIDTELNVEDIEMAIEHAGPYGIGDGRPMFAGKFALIDFKTK